MENGGTLFVVLCPKEDFFIHTGTKSTSGTGRNQKTTEHVAPHTNYGLLPFKAIDYCSSSGKMVFPSNNIVADFHKSFQSYFSFETYIKGEKLTNIIFTTKNKDRILGAYLKINKGFVVFIPNISFEWSNLYKYSEKTDKFAWNSEGIKIGKIFINSIVEIDKVIRKSEDKTPKPNWLLDNSFDLAASLNTKLRMEGNQIEIQKRQEENEELSKLFEEQESLKDLLFETGKSLENAVTKALKILGYKAENYCDAELELDQIILSPEGQRFIGECEGKDTKDIDVSKFRQLLDGLNADFEKDGVEEKAFGLLLGNPQRLLEPKERTLSFTQKCVSGAKREGIGLVKTMDLFFVCRHILENNDINFAKACRKAILEQLGGIIEFPKP